MEKTEEDKLTNTLAEIALNEGTSGSYFIADGQITWLTAEGIMELAERLNNKAVERQLDVSIQPTSSGIMISWRPRRRKPNKNARNS